jgi:hypothetical protein
VAACQAELRFSPRNCSKRSSVERLKLVLSAEIRRVLKDVAEGNIDVFGKLQPRLYKALPLVPMVQEQIGERPTVLIAINGSNDRRALLKAVMKAASRGLALFHAWASSYSSSLPAHRQGLLCIARVCEATAAMTQANSQDTGTTSKRARLETALQSAGAQHSLCGGNLRDFELDYAAMMGLPTSNSSRSYCVISPAPHLPHLLCVSTPYSCVLQATAADHCCNMTHVQSSAWELRHAALIACGTFASSSTLHLANQLVAVVILLCRPAGSAA